MWRRVLNYIFIKIFITCFLVDNLQRKNKSFSFGSACIYNKFAKSRNACQPKDPASIYSALALHYHIFILWPLQNARKAKKRKSNNLLFEEKLPYDTKFSRIAVHDHFSHHFSKFTLVIRSQADHTMCLRPRDVRAIRYLISYFFCTLLRLTSD